MAKRSRKKHDLPKAQNIRALLARIFSYAWRHRYVFAISVVATAILAASNTAFLALIKEITDKGFDNQYTEQRFFLPIMLFSLMAVRGLTGFVSMYSVRWIARRIVERLRREAFGRLMQMPVSFFDAQSTGVMVSKLTYDVERLSSMCTRTALNVFRDVLTMLGLLGYMLYLDWRLTLIFALVTPLMALYLLKITRMSVLAMPQ